MNNGFVCNSYDIFNLTVNVINNKYIFYVNNKLIKSYTDIYKRLHEILTNKLWK